LPKELKMSGQLVKFPTTDPTLIFEHFRGSYGSELLTAAVAHFDLFRRLADQPQLQAELRLQLGLAERPMQVLVTALRAMGLLAVNAKQHLCLTPLASEHLAGGPFDVSDYLRLSADAPGVRGMIERLVTNRPASAAPQDDSSAWIYKEGNASAMDEAALARHFTLALAGRAKNVAPHLAERAPLADAGTLVDVGGGSGIYAIACLQKFPRLKAIVWDRAEVLKVAAEFAATSGVVDRLTLLPGDMLTDSVPPADAYLLSNILHDWDVPECQRLIARLAGAMRSGNQLLIHDVYLNDALDGPLPIALYSAALFTVTEGRAYSAAEYRAWLSAAGMQPGTLLPTLVHCALLPSRKR
jgi:hypothetical protein